MEARSSRVDLFTTIHKGLRAMLFELAIEAARIDARDAGAIERLAARIHRALEFLAEHAAHEDAHVIPAIRAHAPEIATALSTEHEMLDTIEGEVELAVKLLLDAPAEHRPTVHAPLVKLLNRLIAAHLAHMGREETDGNMALWCGFDDRALVELRGRLVGSIPARRYAQWLELIAPALDPEERARITGGPKRAVGRV